MSTSAAFPEYMHATNYLNNDLLGVERHTVNESSSTLVDWPQPAYVSGSDSYLNFLLSHVERKVLRGDKTAYISSSQADINGVAVLILPEYQEFNTRSKALGIHYSFVHEVRKMRAVTLPLWSADCDVMRIGQMSVDVKGLRAEFKSDHWDSIDYYLSRNRDLIPALRKIADSLPRYSEVTDWYLECDEDDSDCLYLILHNNLSAAEEVCELEAKIFVEVFEELSPENQGRIVLSLV